MTYLRVVSRNGLTGTYDPEGGQVALISGDLRRLELDQRDQSHLRRYAEYAGITDHQAWLVLTAFFTDFGQMQVPWLAAPCWPALPEGKQ